MYFPTRSASFFVLARSRLSLAPLLQAFGMAGGTEAAGSAGEHQEMFRLAVRTADAGEPAAGVAAV